MKKMFNSLIFILVAGCGGAAGTHTESAPPKSASLDPAAETIHETASADAHAHGATPHWGYKGEAGPSHWGDLAPEFAMCKTGQHQSPIDVHLSETQVDESLAELRMNYTPTPLAVLNNGHSIQVNVHKEGETSVMGETFTLKQFHFHAPSENIEDGKPFAGEMHLVHAAGDKLAVISVMFDIGDANPAFQSILDNADRYPGSEKIVEGLSIDPNDLLPESNDYWFWDGSLTTPPCSEHVDWYLLKQPVSVSQAQIDAFTAIIGPNARPTLALHDRVVKSNH